MEKEAKFPVPDPARWQSVAQSRRVAGFDLVPLGRERQVNIYYDTEEGTLAGHGYACRVREVEGRLVLAVKGPAQKPTEILHRYEAERQVEADELEEGAPPARLVSDLLPCEVSSKIGALGPLCPLLRSGTERRIFALEKDGRRVCEMVLDEVNFDLARGEAPVYREIELELAGGSEGELARLVRWIREEWGLRPSRRSKLEIGLSLAGRPWPPQD